MSKRQQDRRATRAQQAVGAATTSATTAAATRAGSAAQRAGAAVTRAGSALEQQGVSSAPAVGAALGTAVETAFDVAGSARQLAGRLGEATAETVSGLVDEPAVRGMAALQALRGAQPPRRRWTWAVGAALAGATAGAAVAVLVRRLGGGDAPGAQEPHELRAVVDVPTDPGAGGVAAGVPAGRTVPGSTPPATA